MALDERSRGDRIREELASRCRSVVEHPADDVSPHAGRTPALALGSRGALELLHEMLALDDKMLKFPAELLLMQLLDVFVFQAMSRATASATLMLLALWVPAVTICAYSASSRAS